MAAAPDSAGELLNFWASYSLATGYVNFTKGNFARLTFSEEGIKYALEQPEVERQPGTK